MLIQREQKPDFSNLTLSQSEEVASNEDGHSLFIIHTEYNKREIRVYPKRLLTNQK